MSRDIKLRPCIICESTDVNIYKCCIELNSGDSTGYAVYCNSCGMRGSQHRLKSLAISTWDILAKELLSYRHFKEDQEV